MPSVVIRFIPPTHTIGARLPSGLARASVDVTKSMHCALITTRLPLSGYLQLLCPTAMAKGIQLGLTAKRPFACLNYSNRDVQHMSHHDCIQINLRSAIAVRPQRLHHCALAWPCGQALSLSFGLAAKLFSTPRPSYRPRCAARQRASIWQSYRVQPMVGRISIAFKLPCYLQLLCVHSDC